MKYGSATIVGDPASLELEPPSGAAAAVYDKPIALRLLYEDPDSREEHYLVRYPAGAYAQFPAGQPMRHQATEAGPCLFVLLFHGAFDVELLDA